MIKLLAAVKPEHYRFFGNAAAQYADAARAAALDPEGGRSLSIVEIGGQDAKFINVENGFGVIVNIGGVTGHIGAKNRAHVCTAKAGLVGFTKAIAVEFAGKGITANCLVPGKIGGERSATSGASPCVGCAWIVPATSSSRAPISSANPNADDISETPRPTA